MAEKILSDKISATVEDYLGVMYVLERDAEPVAGVRLSELLGVTPPTVTNTLKRMARDGLITIDAEHHSHLTETGMGAARSVMRRHMLAEWMLTRMLSWSKVHREAHEFEHAMSSEVEAALFADLDSPEVCPHGNPFPGFESLASEWITLVDAPVGKSLKIRRIHEFAEDNDRVLLFLEENRIGPGQDVVIRDRLPFNETLDLCVADRVVSLGFALARYIYAEVCSEEDSAG